MKKFLTVIAFTASLVPMAFAGEHAAAGLGGHTRAGAQQILSQLNLTAEQTGQIKAIHEADRQANQALYSSLRAKVAEYRQLTQANDPRADAVKAELQPLRDQVKAARKATHEKVLAVLTADQRAQLQQMRSQSPGFRGRALGRHAGAIAQQLNLTADQKAQIKAIRQEDHQKNQALFSSMRAKAAQYRQLKQANDPNAAAVKSELEALRPQVKAARTATRDRILSVLTPEQRTQLDQLRVQHRRKP